MGNDYNLFKVNQGWMGVVKSKKGIQKIFLPGLNKKELQAQIRAEFPECQESKKNLRKVQREFQRYFSGHRVLFRFPLDLSRITPFQKKVYRVMSRIPYGQVRSYGWLAQKIGNPRALRAVGGANAKNPWPLIIPCHRIVGSDGRLTGFSAPGGLQLKTRLLKLEGISVGKNKVRFD